MRDFRRALRSAVGKPLAYDLRDGFGAVLAGTLERVARGERVHDAEIMDAVARGPSLAPSRNAGSGVAIVPMHGIALYDCELPPLCFSTLRLAQTVTQLANDPAIETIFLDCSSPGGSVVGVPEAADAVFAARQKKKVVALVNPLCASACYYIASQASIVLSIPSGDCASIGVFVAHRDCSGFNEKQGIRTTYIFSESSPYKVEGNPDEPLAQSARDHLQSEVDSLQAGFIAAVARGRGTSVSNVRANFGKGRCMMAPAAKAAGLIDHIVASPDAALALASSPAGLRAVKLSALRDTNSRSAARRRRLELLRA
jgi:signal peptide peptidase SppA